MSFKNIILNMMKPGYFPVMFNKIIKRIKEPRPSRIKAEATRWYAERASDTLDFMKAMDPVLYKEAVEYNDDLNTHGQQVMDTLPVKMGGGGNCVLLYFLTRYLKPETIVETGVSMGFSSHAFLSGIQKNSMGRLFSSDFPYFRLPDPEQFIGCVVEEHLKKHWTLLIEGDQKNLQAINTQIKSIDLFHYDSDKSYAGRTEAIRTLQTKISGNTTVVFDDIGDNFHFRDWVESTGQQFVILQNPKGGYVGMVGKILMRS